MQKIEVKKGTCRICGCTMNNLCFNPKAGFCWWTDDKETLCSHCDGILKNNPLTVHRVNDIPDWEPTILLIWNPDGE